MRFDRIPYMEWAKTRDSRPFPEQIDLANSGMVPLINTLEELGIDPSGLPLGGPNSYGYPPLLDALASRYSVSPEQVLVAQGASMANFVLLASLVEPGDTLLVEKPVYQCMSHPAAALGAKVVFFQRRAEQQWKLQVDEIAALADEHHATGVFLSNPNNPTGAFDDDATIAALAEALGEHRFLIVDEIYREWLEGEEQQTAALIRPNVMITSSLTKVWGLSGLRAGWIIAPREIVRLANRAYDHMGVNTPFPIDWMVEKIISDEVALSRLRREAMGRIADARTFVDALLTGSGAGGIESVMPVGGGFATWSLRGMDGDQVANALNEVGVTVTPGHYFGVPDSFRLSWTRGIDVVEAGMQRMGHWLEKK